MDPISNFVAVMRDLDACCAGFDQYNLARIPGLLRLLLIDGLADQVNREFRLKIRYRVGISVPTESSPEKAPKSQSKIKLSDILFYSYVDSLDPEAVRVDPGKEPLSNRGEIKVDKDKFYKLVIMVADGEVINIKQLIENLAYVHGLVHPGEPKTPQEEALLAWRRKLQIGGVGAGLREIRAIGRVVHRGLTPVLEKVTGKYRGESATRDV